GRDRKCLDQPGGADRRHLRCVAAAVRGGVEHHRDDEHHPVDHRTDLAGRQPDRRVDRQPRPARGRPAPLGRRLQAAGLKHRPMTALRDAIDYTTLGWVKPELDETLRQARIEIEDFAADPADTSRMRFCAGYLHQVQGTLRMVELYAPAMVAEEMERLAQALQDGAVADRDAACAMLMRGVVLLPDYLERLQSGHKDIPIVLLPLLNDLRAARGETG